MIERASRLKGNGGPKPVLAWLTLMVLAIIILANWRHSEHRFSVYFVLGFVRLYGRLYHGCHVYPHPPIPETGGVILISNHTASSDPVFVQVACRRLVAFLYAHEFSDNVAFLRWILKNTHSIPVNREGVEIRATREALRKLKEGRVIGIFPEGNLRGSGGKRLRPARCGAALIALRSKAPVFPIYISGGPQHHAIMPAWTRPSKKKVRVKIGPALDLQAFYDRPITRPLLEELTQVMMAHIAALAPDAGKGNP